jgi:hypothetical protein
MTYKGVGNRFPLGKGEEYDRRVEFLITKKYLLSYHLNVWNIIF